jgi:hypothetical protein
MTFLIYLLNHEKFFKMTTLKSIMNSKTVKVLDIQDKKNIKGGKDTGNGGGIPPPTGVAG